MVSPTAGPTLFVVVPLSHALMKKFYLACLLIFCLQATTARAQDAAAYKTEALTATQQLAALVTLDDARLLPVRRLTQTRLAQEAEMRQLYANDPAMLQNKLRVIGQEYTTQLGTILTAAQYQRYLAAAAGTLPAAVAAVPLPAPEVATPVVAAAPAKTTSGPSRVAAKTVSAASQPRAGGQPKTAAPFKPAAKSKPASARR